MGWINQALDKLPGTDDDLFKKLWGGRRLLFDGRYAGDIIDECSARLVSAAITLGNILFVVVPDSLTHRSAFLLATALIRSWYDRRNSPRVSIFRPSPVLYYGSAVGIRDQLGRTTIPGLQMRLSDVFSQQDVSRGATSIKGIISEVSDSSLPPVITVYSPADPVGILRSYEPSWIAIDCSDVASLVWLRPLLDEAARRKIPVVAWGQNPLSECLADFDNTGKTFVWPSAVYYSRDTPPKDYGDVEVFLAINRATSLLPIVLSGKSTTSFSNTLREATVILSQLSQSAGGQLVQDAIAVHWRFLRSLECIAVPPEFYDAEANQFWGLKSFAQLRSACDRFLAACAHVPGSVHSGLERVGALLAEAKKDIESQGCALWKVVASFCVDEPPSDEIRIILFISEARKRLFLFALLARYNLTPDDLRELRIYVGSLSELRLWSYYRSLSAGDFEPNRFGPPADLLWHVLMVGLPSPTTTPRLMPVFHQPKIDLLLHPHQCSSFTHRFIDWSLQLNTNRSRLIDTICALSGLPRPDFKLAYPDRVVVAESVQLNVETTARAKATVKGPLWSPKDTTDEVARLFQDIEESAGDEPSLIDEDKSAAGEAGPEAEEIWCQEAVFVQFDQGWSVYFAPNDIVNMVKVAESGSTIDPRSVRSLKPGDQVLLIHGQKRQNLYDLIISRVHKHPSIELHLAMIGRWQEDLRTAFEEWRTRPADPEERRALGSRDLDGLLRRMRARGSHLVTALALSYWLRGLVLAPLDPEDLRRVAEVLDMGFVKQYHRRINQAANRLRGLHRGLSIKLNRWLEDHATGVLNKSDHEVIDHELGLTFGDMRNSLLLLKVLATKTMAGPFLRANLGRPQKER